MIRHRNPEHPPVEHLEAKTLLSGQPIAGLVSVVPVADPSDVIESAWDLGQLQSGDRIQIQESIGQDGIDVDFYALTLTSPATVVFEISSGTLGIYDNSTVDPRDLQSVGGHRLLSQVSSTGTGAGTLQRLLAAGTYFVAASAVGNSYFHHSLAGSGLAGAASDYSLDVTINAWEADGSGGPVVLESSVDALVARLNLSGDLGFVPTIQLLDGRGANVPLRGAHYNNTTYELQVSPAVLWSAGQYQVVLKDASGAVRQTFDLEVLAEITGESGLMGNDTPATAIDLGELQESILVQVPGIIGDDPYFYTVSGGSGVTAGNDVDLYHFKVTSSVPIGLQADVFAGRTGFRFDPGFTLYKLNPADGTLVFVAGNNNSSNVTQTADGSRPLSFDAALAAGLEAGDYYIAVSHGMNAISPLEFQDQTDGLNRFDPSYAHSAQLGWGIGEYVLNLRVIPIPDPPQVVDVSIPVNGNLTESPTEFTIQFSGYMNLTSLAVASYLSGSSSAISSVYFQDSAGRKFFPRLTNFDSNLTAHFLVLDRLQAGTYTLHLDGSRGLSNLVGAPLVGNSQSGHYVVPFSVTPTIVNSNSDPLKWSHSGTAESATEPQELGTLFPLELQTGVNIVRTTTSRGQSTSDTDDYYSFELLQDQSYFFQVRGNGPASNATLELLDPQGNVIAQGLPNGPGTISGHFRRGSYVLHVGNWSGGASHAVSYQVTLKLTGVADNAPALFSGPGPAVGIRLAGSGAIQPPLITDPGIPKSNDTIGIPRPGGSSQINRGAADRLGTSDSGSYYLDRLGAPQVSLPSGSDNFVIAIPTLNSQLGADSTHARLATRSTVRGSGVREGLGVVGLSVFADGMVGNETLDNSNALPHLELLAGLRSLFDSVQLRKTRNGTVDDAKTSSDAQANHEGSEFSSDEVGVDGESVTIQTPGQGEPRPAGDQGDDANLVTKADKAGTTVDSSAEASLSTTEPQLASLPVQLAAVQDQEGSSLTAIDTVFAGGVSLLILEALTRNSHQSLDAPSSTKPNSRSRNSRLIPAGRC